VNENNWKQRKKTRALNPYLALDDDSLPEKPASVSSATALVVPSAAVTTSAPSRKRTLGAAARHVALHTVSSGSTPAHSHVPSCALYWPTPLAHTVAHVALDASAATHVPDAVRTCADVHVAYVMGVQSLGLSPSKATPLAS
jgi:hypothetical protein